MKDNMAGRRNGQNKNPEPGKPAQAFKSRTFKLLVGLSVTVLALWLSLRGIDWKTLWQSLKAVHPGWVILAVVNNILSVYLLGVRWKPLLKRERDVPLYGLFQLNIVSQCANILFPARLGEVLRIYWTSKKYGISLPHVTGTVAIEKILDFVIFVILWVLVPPLFAVKDALKGTTIALILCLATAVLLFFFVWRKESVLGLGKSFSRILPRRIQDRVVSFFDKSLNAFALMKDSRNLFLLFSLTLLFVFGQILSNYLLFLAFGLKLSFWVALILLLALQVGNQAPAAPGKVGIFELAVIFVLDRFGVPQSIALGYALVLHAVSYLPKILLGVIYVVKLDISFKKKYSITNNES